MDTLTKEELGYIVVFQSVIIIIGFFQTGIIHGAYRMISFSIERKSNANNAVMTYLAFLYLIGSFGLLLYGLITGFNWFWIIGVSVGLFYLWTNWVTNLYISLGRTKLLSNVMLISILVSLLGIPVLYLNPVYGAILLLSIQPIVFIALSFIFNKDFKFVINKKSIPYIILSLKYGFVPFLTGILYYVNLQIERMVIGVDLGLEALGEYYLVFVYTGIYLVIPAALGTLNFPKMMKSIRAIKIDNFNFFRLFGRYLLELTAYLIVVFFATFWLLPLIVDAYLPAHSNGVQYVHIIFWGLVLFTLIDPISFVINAKLHYKELLYIYLFGLTVSIGSYSFLYFNQLGSLTNYAYVNVIFFSAVSLGYIVYFITKGKRSLCSFDEI